MSPWQRVTFVGPRSWTAILWACIPAVACSAQPPITALAPVPHTNAVIAGSQSGVQVLELPSLRTTAEYAPEFANVHDIAYSPDGQRVAVAGGNPADSGSVEILSWPELTKLQTLVGHDDCVTAVQWLSNTAIASASLDHRIAIWNADDGRQTRILEGHSRGITAMTLIDGSDELVSGGIDNSLRVWKVSTGELLRSLTIHTRPVHALAARPAGEGLPQIASCSDDRSVRFWQPTIGRMVRFIRLPAKPLCICWLEDGGRIAAGCDDGSVYLVDPQSVQITGKHTLGNRGWIYSLADAGDGHTMIAGGEAGAVVIDYSAVR